MRYCETPFDNGYTAFCCGRGRHTNPHPVGSNDHTQWVNGYNYGVDLNSEE